MIHEGELYIDGNDAILEYGVFVERYGYKGLIQMPSFKTPESTEWEEYDGAEFDLTDPVLDSKTFSMQFCVLNVSQVSDLFYLLSDGSYHVFEFREIARTYKLRLSQNSALSSKVFLGQFTLSFGDDFPPIRFEDSLTSEDLAAQFPSVLNVQPYSSSVIGEIGYSLDGIAFGRFGVHILDGTYQNILRTPNVRENLKVSVKDRSGVGYDDEDVLYKTKDVQMKLLIRANNITDFWHRWDSFFTALIQPDTRVLYSEEIIEEYECFYKSNSVSKFDILTNGRVWCEFTVTLTFVDDRPSETEYLLATEGFEWVVTEDEEDFVLINKNK